MVLDSLRPERLLLSRVDHRSALNRFCSWARYGALDAERSATREVKRESRKEINYVPSLRLDKDRRT